MNKITTSVYENLTPKQRVVASIEAESRGDAAERKRLIQTCPKVTYCQNDAKFSETMDRLLTAAAGIECELRGHALSFLFAMLNDPKNAHTFLQASADIREAWRMTITNMGIDPEAMRKAGPPANPILEIIADMAPKPKKSGVGKVVTQLKELIGFK